MKEKLAEEIRRVLETTLVIENKKGIPYAIEKLLPLISEKPSGWKEAAEKRREAKEASIGGDEAGDVRQFTKIDMIHAAKYGFTYATQSQHNGEVPVGNILQWLQFYQGTILNSLLTKEGEADKIK